MSNPPTARPLVHGITARATRRPKRKNCQPITFATVGSDFSTEVTQTGDGTVIHVRGEIDVATCERLRDAIEPHLGPEQKLILDFSEVDFMDSACLRVLIQARGALTADGGSLILRNPSDAARRLLTAAQAEDLLHADADEHPGNSNR